MTKGLRLALAFAVLLMLAGVSYLLPTGSPVNAEVRAEQSNEKTVGVDSRTLWTDTEIDVQPGMTLELTTGDIIAVSVLRRVDADGDKSKAKANLPLPNGPAGALIAKIRYNKGGESKVVLVGKRGKITVESGEEGRLLLGINDDNLKDNFGGFVVSIRFDKSPVLAAINNTDVKPSSSQKPSNSASTNSQANTVILVPSTKPWTDTGIELPFETKIELSAKGEIVFDTWQGGSFSTKPDGDIAKRKRGLPIPSVGAGALIAKFRNIEGTETKPIILGKGGILQSPLRGNNRLFLGINDDDCTNNSGEFSVTARIIGQAQLVQVLGDSNTFAYRFPYDLIELGIVIDRISPSDLNRLNLSTNEGFIVRESRTTSILKDDVINEIEGQSVRTLDEVRSYVRLANANNVRVSVMRVPRTGLLISQKQTITVPRLQYVSVIKIAQVKGFNVGDINYETSIYYMTDSDSIPGLTFIKRSKDQGIIDTRQGKVIKSAIPDIVATNNIREIVSLNDQIFYLSVFSPGGELPYKLQLISAENGKVVFSRETEACTGSNSRPTVEFFDGTPYVSIFPICSGDIPSARWLYSLEDGKVVGRFKGDTSTREIARVISESNLQTSAKYKALKFSCRNEDKSPRCRLSYVQALFAENDDPYTLSVYLRGKKIYSENLGVSISSKIKYGDSGIIGSYKMGKTVYLLYYVAVENDQSLLLSYSFEDSIQDQPNTSTTSPRTPSTEKASSSVQVTSQSSSKRPSVADAKNDSTTSLGRTSGEGSKPSIAKPVETAKPSLSLAQTQSKTPSQSSKNRESATETKNNPATILGSTTRRTTSTNNQPLKTVDPLKPEFFGVYLAQSDGKLVQISPQQNYYSAQYPKNNGTGRYGTMEVMNAPRYLYIPVSSTTEIPALRLKGFIVFLDKIDINLFKVSMFATINDFLGGSTYPGLFENNGPAAKDSTNFWINTKWGWGSDKFQIKKLAENMYYIQCNSQIFKMATYAPNNDGERKPATVFGIEIGGKYYVFQVIE